MTRIVIDCIRRYAFFILLFCTLRFLAGTESASSSIFPAFYGLMWILGVGVDFKKTSGVIFHLPLSRHLLGRAVFVNGIVFPWLLFSGAFSVRLMLSRLGTPEPVSPEGDSLVLGMMVPLAFQLSLIFLFVFGVFIGETALLGEPVLFAALPVLVLWGIMADAFPTHSFKGFWDSLIEHEFLFICFSLGTVSAAYFASSRLFRCRNAGGARSANGVSQEKSPNREFLKDILECSFLGVFLLVVLPQDAGEKLGVGVFSKALITLAIVLVATTYILIRQILLRRQRDDISTLSVSANPPGSLLLPSGSAKRFLKALIQSLGAIGFCFLITELVIWLSNGPGLHLPLAIRRIYAGTHQASDLDFITRATVVIFMICLFLTDKQAVGSIRYLRALPLGTFQLLIRALSFPIGLAVVAFILPLSFGASAIGWDGIIGTLGFSLCVFATASCIYFCKLSLQDYSILSPILLGLFFGLFLGLFDGPLWVRLILCGTAASVVGVVSNYLLIVCSSAVYSPKKTAFQSFRGEQS